MASLMENLIEVLEKESGEYENLLALSTRKTPVIVAGNLEELAKITDEEQIVVGRIGRLDAKRQEVFADIANVINKDVKTLKLSDLIEILKQRPEELEKLVEIAKIKSTEASNAIEGIVTTSTRMKQLVEEKTTPKNRNEQEIAGYRDVLNIIHESFDAIPISQNYILQLHNP